MSAEPVHIASRMQRIRPFYVMDLLARARELERQGRSIVHMEIGEPDFVTPEPIVQAGQRALEQGRTHYTPALGLPELRQAIAGHYRERFGVSLDPRRVIVTPGASGALQLVMSVLVNPGEKVLLADPGYPCNRHFVELVNGVPVPVPVGPESGFQLTAAQTLAAWEEGVQAVLVATPSNPTGTLLDPGQLAELWRAVSGRGARLIVDEIYQGLVYGIQAHTALSFSDEVFIINSFSKYFGMTGWRLGWIVAPEAYVEAIDRLAQNIFLAAPTLSQYAALAGFELETLTILERRRQAFQERRDFLLPTLRELGFEIPASPQGAFYLYADCSRFSDDSGDLADRLLSRAGVAVTPGMDFGRNQPERYLRFAYTTSLDQLREGVTRIGDFLRREAPAR
jgi:aspartate/methionine/tyrosine aminotransferase